MTAFQKINHSSKHHLTTIRDCFFIVLITTLSVILYVNKIGFYSDDWGYINLFFTSKDQSISVLFNFLYDDELHRMRPIHHFYWVVLYRLLGIEPFGYHIAISLMFTFGVIIFYLLLRLLIQYRLFSLSITIIYAMLPHYSADHLWVSTNNITLSMTLYFVSLYLDLRALQRTNVSIFIWKLLSIITMILSTLSYEVFLPFFSLNPLLVLYRGKQLIPSHNISNLKLTLLSLSSIIILIILIIFKINTSVRHTELGFIDQIIWFVGILKQAFLINFGIYGLGLPIIVFKIIRIYFDFTIFMTGLTTGVIIFVYLYREFIRVNDQFQSQYKMFLLVITGIFLFILGYAIFLTTQDVQITLAGNGNRTAIAGAIGVAISMVGAIGMITYVIHNKRLRKIIFFILVSIICTCGFIINNTIASFWGKAYVKQQEVLDKIKNSIRYVPQGSTLLLDGICPYIGPGIVFETWWDTGGALRTIYGKDIRADIIKPNLTLDKDGVTTVIYNGDTSHYQYGDLFVFNFSSNILYQLKNETDARFYFKNISPNYKKICPEGVEGIGVPIFWNELHRDWNTWEY